MPPLLTDDQLATSSVVANCRMNRERALTGGNGYQREIGLHPLDFLRLRPKPARWLDLCCGTGRALLQATELLAADEDIYLVGVDLVGLSWPAALPPRLRLIASSLHAWQPDGRFDLITCVHGLHDLGDKLDAVRRAASWLTDDGLFVANLDLANPRDGQGRPLGRAVSREWHNAGLGYDARRRRVVCLGRREVCLPFEYLGADDTAGPNYTRQPAVNSFYRPI